MSSDVEIYNNIRGNLREATLTAYEGQEPAKGQANNALGEWERDAYPMFMAALSDELSDETDVNQSQATKSRRLCGMLFKNALRSDDPKQMKIKTQRWLAIDAQTRKVMKGKLLQALGSNIHEIGITAAACVGCVAVVEIPEEQWNDLIEILVRQVTAEDGSAERLKQIALTTLQYICEDINPLAMKDHSTNVLAAIVMGSKPKRDLPTRIAAANALYGAIGFSHTNFETQEQRQYIMANVMEFIANPVPEIRKCGYACLARISHEFYDYLSDYIVDMFQATLWTLQNEVDETAIVQQALEVWSTIAEEEIDINDVNVENQAEGRPLIPQYGFIAGAAEQLVPLLCTGLKKTEEELDLAQSSISTASAACLDLVARCIRNQIVPLVVGPFTEVYINNPDPRIREAAIMAFGAIMEGPKAAIHEEMDRALPAILERLKDSDQYVRDTTAWAVGRIACNHAQSLHKHQALFLDTVTESLSDLPSIAANICWSLSELAGSFTPGQPNNPFHENNFTPIIRLLLATVDREDSNLENLRTSAYDAIDVIIRCASPNCSSLIDELTVQVIIPRLQKSFTIQNREEQADTQRSLVGVLHAIFLKQGNVVSDEQIFEIMTCFNKILSQKLNPSVVEDTILAIDGLISGVQDRFKNFLPEFVPRLLECLVTRDEFRVCKFSVEMLGTLSTYVAPPMRAHMGNIISCLLDNLKDDTASREIKPVSLAGLGDVALALGGDFAQYFEKVTQMLEGASNHACNWELNNQMDSHFYNYLQNMREAIISAYSSMLQALDEGGHIGIVPPKALKFVLDMLQFLNREPRTPEITAGAVGLLGDIIRISDQALADFNFAAFERLLLDCREIPDDDAQKTVDWTFTLIENLQKGPY